METGVIFIHIITIFVVHAVYFKVF